jgi:hypothetical protein
MMLTPEWRMRDGNSESRDDSTINNTKEQLITWKEDQIDTHQVPRYY